MRPWWALLWIALAHGQVPFDRWATAVDFVDRHPSLLSGARIAAPAGTWQTLFGVLLPGRSVDKFHRHCVHLRVPTKRDGILRVTLVGAEEDCVGNWEGNKVWEATGIDDVRASLEGGQAQLSWSDPAVRQVRARTQAVAGAFLFSPESDPAVPAPSGELWEDGRECSLPEGSCRRCRNGFARVVGESMSYRCGIDRCGEAGQPACPRGVRWQKSRGPFSCRGNHEHVFCARGLRVECQGAEAHCR